MANLISEIFKLQPHSDPIYQLNYLFQLSLSFCNCPVQKYYGRTKFQTSKKRFRKVQEAIWLMVIYDIFNLHHNWNFFFK